jgi:DNA polymerase-1
MPRYVPGHGPTDAKIMVVGEAPGEKEEYAGRPFVGPAGNELRRMLNEAGILSTDCYFTNVFRFRPDGNEISMFLDRRKKQPGPDWVQYNGAWVLGSVRRHIDDLLAEVQALNPDVIVCCGETALWALTGLESITKWRGSMLRWDIVGNTYNVLPVIHPSAILREWSRRADTVHDLKRVHKRPFIPPSCTFYIDPSFEAIMDTLENIRRAPPGGARRRLVLDIETSAQTIVCVGLSWSKSEAIVIPLGEWTLDQEAAIVNSIVETLRSCDVVGQNLLYDLFMMALWWGHIIEPRFDTMIAQNVLFPGKEKSLDYLASIYCDYYCYWKDDVKDWGPRSLRDLSLWEYNAKDCIYTYEIHEVQERALKEVGLSEQFEFQMSLFTPTLRSMLTGVRLDGSLRTDIKSKLEEGLEQRTRRLEYIVGEPVNPHNSHQLRKLFYEDLRRVIDGRHSVLNIPIQKHRKTGRPTLNDDALDALAVHEPLLERPIRLIQEARTMRVLLSTFIEKNGPDNRFYCGLNPAGTKTFRFSSSANPLGWGTNGQNIPKWEPDEDEFHRSLPNIRDMFVADEGHVLVSMDLVKADLHVVVWESGEEELAEMLANGVNIYKAAAGVIGMPYKKAKSFIHGTNYGGSYRTMARTQKITEKEARAAQDAWFKKYPGIRRWHKRVEEQLLNTHSVSNMFGYRIIFFDRVDGLLPEALAWIPQSTVACVINRVWRRLVETAPEVNVLLQVHDELLMQVREEDLESAVEKIKEASKVVVPYPNPLTIPSELKVGKRWGKMETL